MSTFEVGKSYYATSACDHNCVFVVEIVKRTAKTVTFRRDGQERRAKIYADHNGEYIVPERYSMAPGGRRDRRFPGEGGHPLDPRRHHGGDPMVGWPHLPGGPGGHSPRRVAVPLR